MRKKIKCTEPYITKFEKKYISNVFTRKTFANDGYYASKCISLIQRQLKAKKILLTNSCTTAIEIALLSLNLKSKDEVIVSSYTFVSSVDVVCKINAKIIFCDINDKFLIDLKDLKNKITKNTKAIILTHYNGNSVDFEKLNKIIKKKNICIIEDAAQAYGSKYKNQYLGTIGDFGCFSYHQTKNIHCGTGGALLINNLKYDKIATIIWNRGTNRSDFFKGNASKYVWINKGSTAYLSEIQAAFLYSQLKNFNKVQKYRKLIFDRYIKQLKQIKDKIILPSINNFNISNYHLFYILLPEIKSRSNFIKFMKEHKIEVTSHYEALHLSPMIRNKLKIKIKLPLSEELSKKLVRLPMHMNLKAKDIDYISFLTKKFIFKS